MALGNHLLSRAQSCPAARRCGSYPVQLPGWDFMVNYSPAALLPHHWILFSTAGDAQLVKLTSLWMSWAFKTWGDYTRGFSFLFISVSGCRRNSTRKAHSTLTSVVSRSVTWCMLQHLQAVLSSFGRWAQHRPPRVIEKVKWEVNGMWLGSGGMHRMAGSCKLHIESLLDNYTFYLLPTFWSGDLLFFICTIYIFLAIHNIFCIFKRSEQAWERDGMWGRHGGFNPEWTIFYASICFPWPVLNTAVRTRGSLKRLFWLMECSCIKLEIHPKILEGGRQRWLRAMKGTQNMKGTCARSKCLCLEPAKTIAIKYEHRG